MTRVALGVHHEREVAVALARDAGAWRVERLRLKDRVRARSLRYLREEIALTVASQDAIDDEIRVLFDALE